MFKTNLKHCEIKQCKWEIKTNLEKEKGKLLKVIKWLFKKESSFSKHHKLKSEKWSVKMQPLRKCEISRDQ